MHKANFFSKKSPLSHILFIMVVLIIINFLWLKSAILGVICLVFWLIGLMGAILGAKLMPEADIIGQKIIGLISGLGLIILGTACLLYINQLNGLGLILILIIISLWLATISQEKKVWPKLNLNFLKIKAAIKWPLITYLGLWAISLAVILASQTSATIRTPWETVPKIFFGIYFLLSLSLLKMLLAEEKNERGNIIKQKLIALSLFYFLSLSVAWLVYKIGFGFDPFVHRAAENTLAGLGYILPKPLYYAGQYGVVVFLSRLFTLPLNLIDKILVPALASLTLPGLLYITFKKYQLNSRLKWLAILAGLVIYGSLFFNSLPQSLANLFLIWLVLLNLVKDKIKINFWQLNLLGLAIIFLIHPLSAVAGIIYLTVYSLDGKKQKIKSCCRKIAYLVLSLLAPLFFVAGGWLGKVKISFGWENLSQVANLFKNFAHYLPFYSIYHLIYLYQFNWLLLYILLLALGAYFLWQKGYLSRVKKELKVLLILVVNLILLGLVEYGEVIDYEQGEFIKRWGQIIILVSSPLLLSGVYYLALKIKSLKAGKTILIFLLAAILSINIYLAYPHNDAFTKGRGYSVSQSDLLAVKWIEQDGTNKDYVVLANQSVSAAALQEFGFKKYYHSLFYYPIPTSSPLYDIYLKMVYDNPNLKFIQQAAELTGVKRVYFVINSYWLDSQKIIQQAKQLTPYWQNINNQVWVFRFDLP